MPRIHAAALNATARPVIQFDAYPDTISVHFPRPKLAYRDWEGLCELYGARPHYESHTEIGCLIAGFQSPQPDLLRELTRLSAKYGGTLRSLDIALDARHDEDLTVEEQYWWIMGHLLMKQRAARRIDVRENEYDSPAGHYFCRKGAPRNICGYWGLEGKLDPESNLYAHIDVRLGRRAICHIEIADIEHLNPSPLLLRHIRFVEFDRTAFQRKYFGKIKKENSIEQAQAQIARLKRYGQLEFAQRVHDQGLIKLRDNNGLVLLPDAFSWGAKRRSMKNPLHQGITDRNVRMGVL